MLKRQQVTSEFVHTFSSLFLAAVSIILFCDQLERFIASIGIKHSTKLRVSCEESKESGSNAPLRPRGYGTAFSLISDAIKHVDCN